MRDDAGPRPARNGPRIAIPIHSFEPGGVERVALRLAERWQAEGEDVVIVLGRDRGTTRETAPALDYRTRREPFATDAWETIWMMWSLLRFLASERVDVIYCPGNTYTIVCVTMKLLLGRRCPPVLVKISNDLERQDLPAIARPFYRLWLRIQGKMLEQFVALAEPMRGEIEREMRVAADRVAVIPDPALSDADMARFADRPARDPATTGRRFLSIGRLSAQKNQLVMIEAFARHAGPHDTLVIAGEGGWRGKLEAQIARLGLQDRISLPGHANDIPALFDEADVFVLSSDYEGVPAVVLEALAAGIPVVSTNCCVSMDWLTGYGRFGAVVPVRDPDALGQAMVDTAETSRPAEDLRQLAKLFTLEQSSRKYMRQLASLAETFQRQRVDSLHSRVWRTRWTGD